jgi:Rieske [2Fe-2S] domain
MSVDVGPVGDFPMKHMRIIDVGARQIGVVRWGDRIFAVNNLCAHQGGPVCRGVLSGRLAAFRPGELTLDDSAPTLACPGMAGSSTSSPGGPFWIRNSGCALSLLALSMDACWST